MAKASAPLILAVVLIVPVLITAVVLGPAAFDIVAHRRAPERYIVPAGFTGWARVDFLQPGAAPLPLENGHRVMRLDAQGRLRTSDRPLTGHAKDEFFAPSDNGLRPLPYLGMCKGGTIWGLETLVDEHTGLPFTRFFIGSEGEYRHDVDPSGKNFPSC